MTLGQQGDGDKVVLPDTANQNLGQGNGGNAQQADVQPTGEQSGGKEPAYITADVLDKKLQEFSEASLKQMQSIAQSFADRKGNQINAEMQAQLDKIDQKYEAWKAQGLPVTEQMRENARNKLLESEFTNDLSNAPTPRNPMASEVEAAVLKIYEEAGIEIERDDPEAKLLDNSSYIGFYESVRPAVEAKRKRLIEEGKLEPDKDLAGANFRKPIGGGPGGPANPWADEYDPDLLIAQGLKKRGVT